MKIELGGTSLNEVQGDTSGTSEARSVSDVKVDDNRNIAMHTVPGMEGGVIQDLGRTAVKVSFDGTVMGASAKSIVEMLRSKFKQGEPVPFNSDVSGTADVTKVVIEEFKMAEAAGNKDRYDYSIVLKEYKEPPAKSTTPPSQDEQAEQWAGESADNTEKSINVLIGRVLDADGNPKTDVTIKAKSAGGEYSGTTDAEGNYRIESLPPGDYEVTVDAEGYEGASQNVSVGESGGKEEPGTREEEKAASPEAGDEKNVEDKQLEASSPTVP